MSVSPYVMYNGQCEEAFRYYEKHLGGKIKAMMPYAGSPAAKDVPTDAGNKILHATITVNGTSIMASDAPAGRYEKSAGIVPFAGYKNRSGGGTRIQSSL